MVWTSTEIPNGATVELRLTIPTMIPVTKKNYSLCDIVACPPGPIVFTLSNVFTEEELLLYVSFSLHKQLVLDKFCSRWISDLHFVGFSNDLTRLFLFYWNTLEGISSFNKHHRGSPERANDVRVVHLSVWSYISA